MTTTGKIFIILFCLAISLPMPGQAAAGQTREDAAKAALIYTFAKFVKWPSLALSDVATDPFVLCHTGEMSLDKQLIKLTGKTIKEHPITVRSQKDLGSIGSCQLLVVGRVSDQQMTTITRLGEEKNILTVSDINGFAEQNGIIELFRVGTKLRFKINVGAARRSELRISSRMLNLAEIVNNEASAK